jgi:hypothetical protein
MNLTEQSLTTGEPQPKLRTVPVTLREANAYVDQYHRHHKGNAKHRISTGVIDGDGDLRGVAIMARPKARNIDQYAITEVVRLATDGCPNACSALYGACCRIGDAAGYAKVITYTLLSEPGTSLRAAGWKPTAVTAGGSWDREDRPRTDSHPLDRKIRWECRHSALPAIDLTEYREAA